MAAKKKKKATKKKSPSRAAKARKAPARKTKVKTKAKKAAKKPVKKAKKVVKASRSTKKTVKKAAKKKQIVGEGDYQASRSFLKDQSDFVKKNKAAIPAMGKDAEKALDGPEGDALREAEASAAGRSRDTF